MTQFEFFQNCEQIFFAVYRPRSRYSDETL